MIYILKFSKPIGNSKERFGTAQYYLGYCDDSRLQERVEEHRTGYGAKITRAAVEQGCELDLVFAMPGGDYELERRLKNRHSHKRILETKRYNEYVLE